MTTYNKQVAIRLYEGLQEVMSTIPNQIDQSSDGDLRLQVICESLGKAINALKPRV
jgi:hypothetical protein